MTAKEKAKKTQDGVMYVKGRQETYITKEEARKREKMTLNFMGKDLNLVFYDKKAWWRSCDVEKALSFDGKFEGHLTVHSGVSGLIPFGCHLDELESALSDLSLHYALAHSTSPLAPAFQKWVVWVASPFIREKWGKECTA